ncbi:hypothetical protein JMJ35_008462 [Cladonia borealis]|uniref:Uncharacterized protein n=1 Tax=Cladonia borealis TaxID=184061 RepID=A0AA39QWE8_9LECA|nr:hypothetical protein JMJ35_008462 [Cladonia borealis]
MHFTRSALFFGASLIGLLLPNTNASPLPTTTASVSDEFHILPFPLPTHGPHKINISGLIFELPTGLVKLPASLVKKHEHPEPTSLCGESCKIINGECKCPPKLPLAMCTEPCKFIEGECVCPQRDTPWPFIGPYVPVPPTEETYPGATMDLTPPPPEMIASLEKHATLENIAVDRKKPQPTFFLCQDDPDCNKGHAAPFTAEAAVISKRRDMGHPTLSHRGDKAEPTITQTSTTTHSPTPTTPIPACASHDVECLNQHHDNHYNTSKPSHHFVFIFTATVVHPPTPTAAIKECPENDRQCQGSFLAPPQLEKRVPGIPGKLCEFSDDQGCQIPPAKEEKEEKRNKDIVLPPNATAIPELNDVHCNGKPWLCL